MLEFRPEGTDNEISYTAFENEINEGFCKVKIEKQYAVITELVFNKDKLYIMEGLVKSALNAAAGKSAYIAVCSKELAADFTLPYGFEPCEEGFKGEIPEILMGRCHKFGNL